MVRIEWDQVAESDFSISRLNITSKSKIKEIEFFFFFFEKWKKINKRKTCQSMWPISHPNPIRCFNELGIGWPIFLLIHKSQIYTPFNLLDLCGLTSLVPILTGQSNFSVKNLLLTNWSCCHFQAIDDDLNSSQLLWGL